MEVDKFKKEILDRIDCYSGRSIIPISLKVIENGHRVTKTFRFFRSASNPNDIRIMKPKCRTRAMVLPDSYIQSVYSIMYPSEKDFAQMSYWEYAMFQLKHSVLPSLDERWFGKREAEALSNLITMLPANIDGKFIFSSAIPKLQLSDEMMQINARLLYNICGNDCIIPQIFQQIVNLKRDAFLTTPIKSWTTKRQLRELVDTLSSDVTSGPAPVSWEEGSSVNPLTHVFMPSKCSGGYWCILYYRKTMSGSRCYRMVNENLAIRWTPGDNLI